MVDGVEYPNLEEYICTKCNTEISEEIDIYCCECWQVPKYELSIDAADIPVFWVEDDGMPYWETNEYYR